MKQRRRPLPALPRANMSGVRKTPADAVPLTFLPAARRKATFDSFSRVPKKVPRTLHKKLCMDTLVRYNPGDVHHGHSHDVKHLDDWMRTLTEKGFDSGLAEAAPQYLARQAGTLEKVMSELLFQTSVAHPKLAKLTQQVWEMQSNLLHTAIGSVRKQSRGYRAAQVELHSLTEKSGLHAQRLQSDKARLAFNAAMVEDRLFNACVEKDVALRRLEEMEGQLHRTKDLLMENVANEEAEDHLEVFGGDRRLGTAGADGVHHVHAGDDGEETFGSDEDEEFKEWHVRKRMDTVVDISQSMERVHMQSTHEHNKQSKLLKDLTKTVRITEKKLRRISNLYGPKVTREQGVETPEEWKTGSGTNNDFEQDDTAPSAPSIKKRGMNVPYRLRQLLPKFKNNVRVMAREKVHRHVLQVYLRKHRIDAARKRDQSETMTISEALVDHAKERAAARAPGSPGKGSPQKSAYVDVVYEILNAVRQYRADPRMLLFGTMIGAFDDSLCTSQHFSADAVDFMITCLAQLSELDLLPAAVNKDGGGGDTIVIPIDRGMAIAKLRPTIQGMCGIANMPRLSQRVNKLDSVKDMGGDRMVRLDAFLEFLLHAHEDEHREWDRRLRVPFEKDCKWYKHAFGMVVEMDPTAVLQQGPVDDGHNTFAVVDFEQWCKCLSAMHFNIPKKRAQEWFDEGCKMHQARYEMLYQAHWKETDTPDLSLAEQKANIAAGNQAANMNRKPTFWYNEETNATSWDCPTPPNDGSMAYMGYEMDFSSFSKICKRRGILKSK